MKDTSISRVVKMSAEISIEVLSCDCDTLFCFQGVLNYKRIGVGMHASKLVPYQPKSSATMSRHYWLCHVHL